jgi:hypothetical protein
LLPVDRVGGRTNRVQAAICLTQHMQFELLSERFESHSDGFNAR